MQKLSIQFFMLFCLSFLSFSASAQLIEDFEGSVPPTGWAIFDNGIGTAQSWQASTSSNTGAQAAYVRFESVTGGNAVDWMVTPLVNISAGASSMVFYQRQLLSTDYGTVYTIRVSTTSQTDTTTFTTIDTQVETDFGTTYAPKTVDLSAYVGQSIYVAFVMEQNDGDNWYIDDLSIGATPCLDATALTASNITATSADISWSSNSGGGQAEVAIVASGAPAPTSGTTTTNNPFAATGLADGTTYDVYVRETCSTGGQTNWVGPVSFTTLCLGVQGDVASDAIVISTPNFNQAGPTDSCYTNSIGYSSADVWFQYVIPSCTDSLYIGLDSSDFDTYLRVYAADASTSLATNDDGGAGSTSRLALSILNNANFNSGDTIYILVEGFLSSTGNYVLDVQATTSSSPAGDWANTAISMNTLPFAFSNATICYSNSTGQAASDVWLQYIVEDCLDSIVISLAGSDYDSYLGIYAADSTTLLFSDDNSAGNSNAALSIPVGTTISVGDTIYILVEGAGTASGNFQLDVQAVFPPLAGNTIQEAISINAFPFSNSGATTGCFQNTIGNSSADVWFQHVLDNCTDTLFISLDSSDFDTYLRVYAADGTTQLDYNDDGGQGTTSYLLLDIINDPSYNAGDTIYILVEGFGSNTGNYGLNVDAVRCDPAVSATVVVNGLQNTYCNANNIPSSQMVIYNGGNSDLAMVPYTMTLSTLPFTILVDTVYNVPMDDSVVVNLPAFPAASGNGIFEVSIEVPGDYDSTDNVYTQVLAISNTVSTVSAVNLACNGDASGTATALGLAGIAPYSYVWDANAGSQTTATATGLNAGTYSVTITDSIGCGTQNSVQITEPTVLTVNAVDNNDGTATANAAGGVAVYSYNWSNGETTASIQDTGFQTVIVTDANGCQASDTVTIIVLSIQGIQGLDELSIFPNPAQDYVNLNFELTESRQLQLQLVALNGQVVYTQSLNAVGQQNLQINTQDLAPAMYMLRIIDEESRTQHTAPIVIQR
ncbi:choice-of-anchor J domain-containing protein [Saprospira sp. CCB-QB6]|uniref:T9SS-dependent choice-of-anchor J family protein n=1 Tax=Saprospira sp. CCB-QB6 TaxID=3023936 RepID=UPI002349D4ED|nr:choice-of-anchor J domain-containing protein [Saprospira sp. CCB-QB6]WCL81845.1 choice-of-anchor J domain-containing protein [Saprospira sp. CCB-QB6]